MNYVNSTKPRWLRDLVRFLPLKSQFVLTGNVRDLQTQEVGAETVAAVPLVHSLDVELKSCGYANVVVFTPTAGFGFASPIAPATSIPYWQT